MRNRSECYHWLSTNPADRVFSRSVQLANQTAAFRSEAKTPDMRDDRIDILTLDSERVHRTRIVVDKCVSCMWWNGIVPRES